ncbi:LamG-like jellyroll fold domain-containing protein [Pseudorhodoferax sp. Leaf265]|uniref:CARDB domain-containing protein n=1 Tax=Pseudorhodoferax sp. Leaf265 TaxID=1736315 RepID=UPI0006F5F0B2|nr:LamG-like jellyroll fold domain-containing protein [Pseudorhodoferax sp. Leaf265]KQP20290.1 hypothetical protein ASF45_21045 [Pseudorhodoferax sp. Leaf265]
MHRDPIRNAVELPAPSAGPLSRLARLLPRRKGRAAAPFKRKLLVETLEQRVLMDADPLAVAAVSARLDSPGEADVYTFTLDNATTVSFNSQTDNGNMRWTLTGPSGTVVNAQGLDSQSNAAAYAPLSLAAGDYKITIDGVGQTTGDYGFRLLDLSRADSLPLGQPVNGTFADGAQQVAYQFDAQAGDALWLDTVTLPSGSNLRLHDPFGNRIGTWSSDTELPLLPYNGRYTLILDGNSSTPLNAAYAFELRALAAPATDLGTLPAAGATVSGSIAEPGDSAVVRFTLDASRRILIDSRSTNNSLLMTLTGPAGLVTEATSGNGLSNVGLGSVDNYVSPWGVLDLLAGSYTLRIDGSGATVGDYALRFVDASSPTAVVRDQSTAGQLNPGGATHVYRIAATAGDSIRMDAGTATVGGVGNTGVLGWTLYDPYGRRVTQASGWNDVNNIALALSGDYTLVVRGDNDRQPATDYAFTVVSLGNTPVSLPAGNAVALGTTPTSGSIAAAGGSQVWRFTLATATTVYFDPLTGGMPVDMFIALQGPRGTETAASTRFGGYNTSYSTDGAQVWNLAAGDYALTVSSSSSAVAAYQFRLLNLAAAASPLSTGSVTQGELNPGSGVAVYSFDAAAGERIFLDGRSSGFTNLERRLIDPWGRLVTGGTANPGTDNLELALPYAGRYTLLVEGHNSIATPQPYSFVLERPVDRTVAYDIGVAQLPGVQWGTDGANPALHFDGNQVATVAADPALSIPGDVSFQLRFKADNLDPTWQSLLYKGNQVQDGAQRNYSMWLNSAGYLHLSIGTDWGEYTVRTADASIQADRWYDVVGVVDRANGKLRIYIDGVQAAESTNTLPPASVPNRTYATPLTIGNAMENWYNSVSGFEGSISEVRVWSRALTAANVTAFQTTAPSASDTSLALWLPMNTTGASTLSDASGEGRNATVTSVYAGIPGVVVGTIDVPGQSVTYTLSLAQARRVFMDALVAPGQFNVTLTGPNTNLSSTDLAWVDNNVDMFDLPAGEYRITVRGQGQQTGSFAFRLLDAAQATAIAYDTTVQGQLRPGDQAQLYRFDAQAGEVVFFDALAQGGASAVLWRLVDPYGRTVFGRSGLSDRENTTLAVAGTYTLVLDGYPYERDRWSDYSFSLRKVTPAAPQPIVLGQSLDEQAQRTAGRNGGGAVAISSTQYVEIDGAATNLAGQMTVEAWFRIDRPSTGTWTELFVKTDGDSSRQYGVWINANGQIYAEATDLNNDSRGITSAAGLVPNVAGGQWQHVALVLDRANSQMRLLLNGAEVVSGYLSPQASLQLADALRLGRNAEGHVGHEGYSVSVDELRIWNVARSNAQIAAGMAANLQGNEAGLAALYRFNEASGTAVVDATGAAGAGGRIVRLADELPGLVVGRIDAPGQVKTYTFTLASARAIYLDNFTHRHDLNWRLTGPTVNIGTSLYGADSTNSYNLLQLPAGTYTFTVDGAGAAVGEFAFRLVDAAAAQQPVALDAEVQTRLEPGAMARLFTFQASAGQRLFLDLLAYTGTQPAWRLLDPTGAQVFGINWAADVDTFTASRTGTYTLILEDYTAAGSAASERDVRFAVRTVQDQTVPLVLGTSQVRPPQWVAGPEGAGSAVQLGDGRELEVSASAALDLTGNFTIEAMVRLDSYSNGWMPVVSRGSDYNHQTFGLWIGTQGQIYLDSHQLGSTNPDYPFDQVWNVGSANGAVSLNAWHRLSASVNRSTGAVAIYVDGNQVASAQLQYYQDGPASSQPGAKLFVGATELTDRTPLYGAVADVRVWNTARTAAQIGATQSTTALAGNEAGLVLLLPISGGSGSTLAVQGSAAGGLAARVQSVHADLPATVVEGRIAQPGQRVLYQLSVAQDTRVLFDTLTANSAFTWSLLDEGGGVVAKVNGEALQNRRLRDADSANSSSSLMLLRAGRSYTLVIDADGQNTGDFAFRLLNLTNAEAIAYDQTIAYPAEPANATRLFSFSGVAGQQIVLDELAWSGGNWPYWRLYDPFGNQIHESYFYSDSPTLTLARTGTYVLAIEGQIDQRGVTRPSFQVHLAGTVTPPALPTGTALTFTAGVATVNGTSTAVDTPAVYTFTLAQPRRIYIDTLNPSTNNAYYKIWNLSSPAGTVAERWAYDTDGPNQRSYYDLPASDYAFSVRTPYDWALTPFAFKLIDIDAVAQTLTPGTAVSGTLAQANSAAFFRFDGEAGTRYFLNATTTTNTGNAYWRLLDAQTLGTVAQGYFNNQGDDLTVPRNGSYILTLEGYFDTAGQSTYGFTLYKDASTTTALTLGSTVSGTLAQPGDMANYSFTLDAAKRLWFDSLTERSDIVWRILDADGIAVFSDRDIRDYTNWYDPFTLAAGSYTLQIDGRVAAAGAFGFRLVDMATATLLTPGTAQSGTLTPGTEVDFYAFNAQAGDSFFFDMVSRTTSQTMYWRLYDPYGQRIWGGTDLQDVDVTQLAYTGRYTLVIEGYPGNTQSANYNVNVVPVLPQTPVALSIGLQPAPNLQVQNLQVSGADGSVHSGGTLNIAWQTTNSGDRALDTAFQERVVVTNAQGQTVVNVLLPYDPAVAGVIGIGQAKARSTQVLLPPGAAGAGLLTITVITDTTNAVLEKGAAGESDNTLQATVNSTLLVYPDLGVGQLAISPAAGLKAGDQVTVSWRDENRGDAAPANGWADRVVVRNTSTGAVVLDQRVTVPAGSAAIAAGGALARQYVFSWPAGANGVGNFEVTVTADADGAVAEYNATDTAESNNAASTQFTSAPDLTIDGLTVLTTTPVSGGLVDLQWTVRNQGNAPTPTGWFDHIVVTNVDTGTTLLNLDVFYTPTSALAVGGSATRSFQLRLPDGQASVGNIRFTVVADQNASNASGLAETNEGNNQAQVTRAAVLSQAANLVVTDFTAPPTQRSGDTAAFAWTVRNSGNAATPGTAWHDRIVLSADATIGNADDVTVATVARNGALAAGASYTVEWSATVPAGYDGNYRFALVTDVFNTVVEPDAENDNVSALRAALLTPYHADLTVSELSLPANGNGGQSVTVSWRTTNGGDAGTGNTWWYDRLWLSPTGAIGDGSGAILLGNFARSAGALAAGASRVEQQQVTLPNGVSGSFKLVVESDIYNWVAESRFNDNNSAVSATSIVLSEAPSVDLRVQNVAGPATARPGQQQTVSWEIRNAGAGAAAAPWTDHLYLSSNGSLTGAIYLTSFTHQSPLAGNSTTQANTQFWMPDVADGNWRVIVVTDVNNQVYESGAADAETGNSGQAAATTAVAHPDVGATGITVSAGAAAGRASTISWTARNDGSAAAPPDWLERVFLSSNDVLDGNDILLATTTVGSAIDANGVLLRSVQAQLPANLAAGSWRIIVQSDADNALRELTAGEANNLAVSAAFAVAEAPLPNLTVSNVAGPASIRAGQAATVTWTERNLLDEPATGDWSAQIYLSSDNAIGGDILVGSASFTGGLAANGQVARSAEVLLPTTLAPGAWRFVVRTDSANRVLERDELDNAAIAATASTVPAALQLNLVASVAEAAGSFTASLQRNGDLSSALTVALVSSDTSEATVPATVTIPAGQALVNFTVGLPADGIVDGTQLVNIAATANGVLGDNRNLNVTDSNSAALTLTSVLAVQENQGTLTMTVSRNTDAGAGALQVRLNSANTAALRVPGIVTIPAGATSVSFQAQIMDDLEVWGTREVRVNAAADGYTAHAVNVTIADDELPELTMSFSSNQVAEGAGANAVGVTLRRDRPGTYDLVFNVLSDNRDALTVPTRVVIPAGETEVHFNASPVDNTLSGDGSRSVNVFATMLNPAGVELRQNTASNAILVTDDDGPTLSVTLSADSVSELGGAITGTVKRNTATTGDLVVTLSSSDTTEARVPTTVTILAGQDSATFSITPQADSTVDGTQAVTIRASASGFSSGAAGLNVTEGDLPDLLVTEIGQPPSGYAQTRIDLSWTVTNQGLATANGGFRDRVYLSRDDVLSSADRLVAAVIHTSPVPQGQSYTQTASILLPEETGVYRVIVVTDALSSVNEGSERNNVGVSSLPLNVRAPITATVQTAVTQLAVSGEAGQTVVPMTGTATDVRTGQAAANTAVKVMVRVGTVERLLDATTDASGKFSVDFVPLPGEAGIFEIGAGFTGDKDFTVQDSFKLLAIEASVPYIRAMGTNETPLEGSFVLENMGNVPLTGLTAAVEGLASNFQFEVVNLATSLAGDGSVTVNWRLTGHGITDQLVASKGMLVLTTAEGATERLVLDLACIPQTPKLVATPGYLAQGMLMGRQTLVSFEVTNQGAADTGPVTVQLPDFPWLKLVSPAVIDNIAAGGKATVTVALSPTEDNADLIRYDGNIALNARLGGLAMPFQFRAVSEAKGEMRVSVEDQLTYYAEGAPKVAGATVTLTDPYTFDVVATATTDASGTVLLTGVPEGNYILTVNADKHSSYRATKMITAGTTSEQTIFLDRQLVSYSWNVVPVEIQDRYQIKLESTFETEVPVPVITVDALKMPVVLPGVTSTITIKVSNHGLIQAEDVRINVPNDDLFEIVALTNVIDILPAKSSVEVPITIRVKDGVTPEMLAAASLSNGGIGPEGWGSAIVKCLGIDTAYKLRCGPDGRWYSEKTDIKPVLCAMDFNEAAAGQLLSYIGDDFNLLDLGCDALDLLLSCLDADDCLSFFINAACGAIVGGVTAGPWGAAAGAAGALDDLLACLCQILGPIGGGSGTVTGGPSGGGGGWGWWYPGGGYASGSGWSYDIQYVNCRGEPVSALEQQRADEGLMAAVASGAVAPEAIAAVEAHNESRTEQLAALAADGDGILNAEEAGICAQVRISIEQEAVLTRTAFQGTLQIVNGNTGVPLTGVQLVLDIRDEAGNAVNDLFAARGPTLTGLTALDGSGVLAGGATGSAQYLFIPTVDAARNQPTRYTIGGTLSYVEGGQKITVPLVAAQITVYPEARLNLHYFQQRDVYGDDPFTDDVVEPSEEFALGLLAYNDGAGDARNFTITSAQPKIIENEKGLLIDFKIVGTQVGDQAQAPTLTANLGNIAAGQTQVAQWNMTSTLQGKFIDYTATFEHLDGMGDTRLSLIESVNIHELIRSVKANAGDAPDFLANDDPDSDHTPDRLYMNDGSQHVVKTLANAAANRTAAPGALAVTLTADAAAGWGYFKIADPGVGYALDRIVRSDGKVLTLGREVWRTDRSFPESLAGAVRENLLHFIDEGSTGSYTAYYKIDDAVAPRLVEVLPVSPDPATAPVDTVDVRFSEALDLASFSVADLALTREGGDGSNLLAGANGITVTQIGAAADHLYRISGLASFTAGNGLYRLTVNATGIADYAGNAGEGVLTETWGMGDIGPYVLSMAAGPAARHTPLDMVDISFNTALDAASFSASDLRLERDGVVQSLAGATLTLTPLAGNQYRLSGLGAVTGTDGAYTLTLLSTGLLSSGGAAGLGSQSVGWRMDTVAPRVLDVVDLIDTVRKTVVLGLDVELSERVDLATFDYRDIVLTRTVAGIKSGNLIDAQTKVEHLSGNTYRVSGFNWVSGLEGTYEFSVSGAGLADEAGNAGTGEAGQSWLMDFHDPVAASAIKIAPDNGQSSTDMRSNQLNFTLSGQLGEAGLSVRVTDRTTGNEIGYATVDGLNFSIAVQLDAAGIHELRVRTVDAAGNLADAVVSVFVDVVKPTLSEPLLHRDADGNVDRITLNFSEPIDPASLTLAALSLTRDGGANLLAGATLTRVSATQYVLSGLAGRTDDAGSYRFSVAMPQVRDEVGNAGDGSVALSFAGQLASTGSISGVVYDDIDGTGTREADELAQGGWTVFADDNDNGQLDAGEVSAVTDDVTGRYTLSGLSIGTHRIVVVAPSGWTMTPGTQVQVTLGADAPDVTQNFGAFALASLSGTVFDDANANGVRDLEEAALAGRLVLLDANANGVADVGEATATTDAQGGYSFQDLAPATLRVVLFAGDGYLPLLASTVYSPKSGEAFTRDIAAVRPGSISGTKYEDVNGNGQRDAGELGVAGWTIFLDDNGNDALDTGERFTQTDADGHYVFTGLLPGSFRVVELARTGWIQTAPGTVEAGGGHEQALDALLTLPGMVADVEEDLLQAYLNETGMNYDCGCGTFVLEKYTQGQAASHFSKMDTLTDPMLASLTGQGVRVVVIDTGVDTDSSFFGPDSDGDGVSDRIVYQYDFGDGDADANDMIGHGTNVAGVIAGQDAQYSGIATGADLVVLKVFDANSNGYFSKLKAALEWVEANAEAYNIGVINMSLGDGGNWGEAISRYGMGELFERLAARGLVTIAASGNNYYQTGGAMGVAYPGADPAVLSVGAMWAGNFGGPWRFSSGATDYTTAYGRIASFTQRDPDQIDVMAPGARFTSAGLNGGLSTMQGTSQAAAFMSGAAALVQQAAKLLMGRYLTTGEFADLLAKNTYRAVDGDDESDNVANTSAAYNKLDIPKLLRGLQAYAAAGGGSAGGGGQGETPTDGPLSAYSARTLQVTPGATASGQDFGNFRLGQVAGVVYADADKDGQHDAGEAVQAGIQVYLDANDNGSLDQGEQSTVTGADGRFAFQSMGPGNVTLRAVAPTGQTAGNDVPLTVTSGLNQTGIALGLRSVESGAFQAVADEAAVDEDNSVTVNVLANDQISDATGLVLELVGDGPAHGSVALVEGQLVYTPDADFHGSDSFAYSIAGPGGRSSSATVQITVRPVNDLPTLDALPDQQLTEGQTLVLQLQASDVDGDPLRYTLLQAPEGTTLDEATGQLRWTAVALSGPQTVRVQVSDGQGGTAERSFSIGVQLGTLRVSAVQQFAWGFSLRFNDSIDASQFNLYGANPDFTVTGARVGPEFGSVVFDADGKGLTWVRTGAGLEADAYTLTLKSGAQALTSTQRGHLDGDANGQAGGDWAGQFQVGTLPTVRLRLPDFARGPGQAVPATANGGVPITLTTDGTVTSLSFLLKADPALLRITEVRRGSQLPAGATLSVQAAEGGVRIIITSATPLAAGNLQLLSIVGTVSATATLGSAGLMVVDQLMVNGAARPASADAGLVFVGHAGDMDGNGKYEANDVTLAQRLIVRLDNHLPWANDIDFLVVGDVTGDGVFNASDAAMIQQRRMAGAAGTATIPAIPEQPVESTTPTLNLAGTFSNFAVANGGSIGLAAASGDTASRSTAASRDGALLPVALKVVPSAVSQGVVA